MIIIIGNCFSWKTRQYMHWYIAAGDLPDAYSRVCIAQQFYCTKAVQTKLCVS